jgi:hypothetical protein
MECLYPRGPQKQTEVQAVVLEQLVSLDGVGGPFARRSMP